LIFALGTTCLQHKTHIDDSSNDQQANGLRYLRVGGRGFCLRAV